MKYPDLTMGKMEAVVNKLGGMEGLEKFLRNELVVSGPTRLWHEKDGVIYFTVTSNGKPGKEWNKHFESKGIKVDNYAKQLLLFKAFKSSKKGTVYNIAVIKGEFFSDENRITPNIREEALRRKMEKPNAEVACLIRDLFTDEEIKAMGLYWIVAMHEPIKDSDGVPCLFGARRIGGRPWLLACYDRPDLSWSRGLGFAFVVSQVSSKN